MKLWLLRHAPVEAVAGMCYGASDLAAQADATRDVAAAFAGLWPRRTGHGSAASASASASSAEGPTLYCSPLRRCTALAQAIVALEPALGPVRIDSRLAEMDFGAWEGQPWDAIERAPFDAWLADFADARAGTHGESTRLFMARVGAAWDAWRDAGQDAVWITHAGVMRAAMLLHGGVRCPAKAAEWPARPIAFGEWMTFEIEAQAGGGVLGR